MSGSTVLSGLTRSLTMAAAALTVAAAVLAVRYRPDGLRVFFAVVVVGCLSVPLVGSAVIRAEPRNPTGWFLLACGVTVPLAAAAYLYSHASFDGAALPATGLAAWLDGWPWTPATTLVPTVGLLLFPDGRSASRRWRWVLWAAWIVLAAQMLNELFAPHLLDYPHRHNFTALPGAAGRIADGLGATIVAVPPLTTLAAWSVHLRYRAAPEGAERAALRIAAVAAWTIAASWWSCGLVIVATGSSDAATVAEMGGLAVLAVTAWIGIHRYGLFAIRRVVSHALVYTTLAGCVLGAYLAVAAIVDLVVSDTVGGALAAVAAVLLALPLRGLLQRATNRLVYGLRNDPYAALDHLGQRLTDAAAPEQVLPGIAASLRQALRLSYVGIQMGETRIEVGNASDSAQEFPLVFVGERVGTLAVANSDEDRPFSAGDRQILAALVPQVASAAHAVSLVSDVRRSQERLVTATEEERRRMRRDLHDGLGAGLAGVVLGLQRARRQVSRDPEEAMVQLDALTQQTQAAIAEVRRLVYDLRPPALDELGLVGALVEQARHLGPICVEGPDPQPPLPAAVEVAAYRIAMEAMTNITRHAAAAEGHVTIAVDGALRLQITDNGVGMPSLFRAGVGITSMRERASQLGGSCTVEAGQPRGTVVRAVIPLAGK